MSLFWACVVHVDGNLMGNRWLKVSRCQGGRAGADLSVDLLHVDVNGEPPRRESRGASSFLDKVQEHHLTVSLSEQNFTPTNSSPMATLGESEREANRACFRNMLRASNSFGMFL